MDERRQTVTAPGAPAAIGPYSHAVRAVGELLFCSGQIPLDPASGELVGVSAGEQARRCLENLRAVCAAAGTTLEQAVRVTIYMTNLGQFAEVNDVCAECFPADPPARVTIGVAGLPRGAQVEIDAVVALGLSAAEAGSVSARRARHGRRRRSRSPRRLPAAWATTGDGPTGPAAIDGPTTGLAAIAGPITSPTAGRRRTPGRVPVAYALRPHARLPRGAAPLPAQPLPLQHGRRGTAERDHRAVGRRPRVRPGRPPLGPPPGAPHDPRGPTDPTGSS